MFELPPPSLPLASIIQSDGPPTHRIPFWLVDLAWMGRSFAGKFVGKISAKPIDPLGHQESSAKPMNVEICSGYKFGEKKTWGV